MNGKETDVDCGGPESGCDPCAENKRCEHHNDCAGRLCLREYDPFPLPPCFVREVETARMFFPMEGNSTPTLVSTDITSLQWQVRGGPNCRVTLYDEFDKPEAVNTGDYIIGSTDAQAFPAKVTKVLVEMSHCAYLEERTGDACSNASGCQWCVALNMCLDIRAVEAGECPVEIWDSDLAPESAPYYVGYNPAEGQGSFGAERGYCQGTYNRRWQVRMDQGFSSQCEQTEYTGGTFSIGAKTFIVPDTAVNATATRPQSIVLDWQNLEGKYNDGTLTASRAVFLV